MMAKKSGTGKTEEVVCIYCYKPFRGEWSPDVPGSNIGIAVCPECRRKKRLL